MGDQGQSVLMDAVKSAITELEKPPADAVCASHSGLAKGVKVLLLCKAAEFSNGQSANYLKVGNITVSGSLAILIVAVAYLLAKVHGVA